MWLANLLGGHPRSSKRLPIDPSDRMPIVILSMDRPHYLKKVLLSLRPQVDRDDKIILSQDGAFNPHSGCFRGDPAKIAQCVRVFQKIIPWGIVAQSKHNLGIALNYERAEQEVFNQLAAPAGLFLEDDLVLAPNFLTVTRMLLNLAKRDKRISYVSAYGNFWADLKEQKLHEGELRHMHENWGFAMTREAWLAERPYRLAYLNYLKDSDYLERNAYAIIRFHESRGWKVSLSNQDAARWLASVELGRVRLTTFSCHARYIGEVGVHFTKQGYKDGRYADAQFFKGPAPPLAPLSDELYERMIEAERRRFTTDPEAFYGNHPTKTFSFIC